MNISALNLISFFIACVIFFCENARATGNPWLDRAVILPSLLPFRYTPNRRTILRSASTSRVAPLEADIVLNVGNEWYPAAGSILPARISQLISTLDQNTNLEVINFAGIGLTDDAFSLLADGLAKQSNLKELNLNWNHLSVKSNANILKVLNGKPMEKIQLAGCALTDQTVIHGLTQVVKNSPRLKVLELRNNKIGAKGTRRIADSLKWSCHQVEKLSFAYNPIGDYGIAAISLAIQTMPELTSLDLQGTSMTLTGAFALSTGFPSMTRMKNLLLSNNPLGDKGTVAIIEQLPKLENLYWLDIRDIGVTDRSVGTFVKALPECKNLKRMRFDYNQKLSYKGETVLFKLIEQLHIVEL